MTDHVSGLGNFGGLSVGFAILILWGIARLILKRNKE